LGDVAVQLEMKNKQMTDDRWIFLFFGDVAAQLEMI